MNATYKVQYSGLDGSIERVSKVELQPDMKASERINVTRKLFAGIETLTKAHVYELTEGGYKHIGAIEPKEFTAFAGSWVVVLGEGIELRSEFDSTRTETKRWVTVKGKPAEAVGLDTRVDTSEHVLDLIRAYEGKPAASAKKPAGKSWTKYGEFVRTIRTIMASKKLRKASGWTDEQIKPFIDATRETFTPLFDDCKSLVEAV